MSRNKAKNQEKEFDATATGVLIEGNGPAPAGNGNGKEKTFNLVVDKVPYIVKARSFDFNGETRFYISVNGNPEHVFTWDPDVKALRSIDDGASTIPNSLEEAISRELLHLQK